MKLSDEELFSLIFTFKNDSNFKTEYLKNAYVIERTNSGVGFFQQLRLMNLSDILLTQEILGEDV